MYRYRTFHKCLADTNSKKIYKRDTPKIRCISKKILLFKNLLY